MGDRSFLGDFVGFGLGYQELLSRMNEVRDEGG